MLKNAPPGVLSAQCIRDSPQERRWQVQPRMLG